MLDRRPPGLKISPMLSARASEVDQLPLVNVKLGTNIAKFRRLCVVDTPLVDPLAADATPYGNARRKLSNRLPPNVTLTGKNKRRSFKERSLSRQLETLLHIAKANV